MILKANEVCPVDGCPFETQETPSSRIRCFGKRTDRGCEFKCNKIDITNFNLPDFILRKNTEVIHG